MWVHFCTAVSSGMWRLLECGGRVWPALGVTVFVMLMAGSPSPLGAVQNMGPLIVRDDPGGDLRARVSQIERLRTLGQKVRILDGYCMSACTMYLGLEGTCVSSRARFGFHGPSSKTYGISLPPPEFEHWSRVMASYYPEPLRGWYMQTGRNITVGFHEISGRDLIDMGMKKCA